MSMEKYLLKHPGSCSGMFWRGNPLTGEKAKTKVDWPRNGSILEGKVHVLPKKVENNDTWLEVSAIKPEGSKAFIDVSGQGVWMIFNQEGPLLHKME